MTPIVSTHSYPRPVLYKSRNARWGKLWTAIRDKVAFRKYQTKVAVRKGVPKVTPAILPVTGVSSFVFAAFEVGVVVGFVVMGLSAFFLEWRLTN